MRKQLAFLVVFLLIFLSTAGCIDIHFVKDLLVPREEEKIEYVITEYDFNDNFTSGLSPDDILEFYSKEFNVSVKPLTKHMRFNIDVVMRSADTVWKTINDSLPEGELKDLLSQIAEQLLKLADQRYVEVTITSPEGVEWFNYKFNGTENIELPLVYSPSEGDWLIFVEGAGAGFEYSEFAYHDSFSIHVVVNEPKD